MAKFKVGDRIRIKKNSFCYHFFHKNISPNAIGIVKKVHTTQDGILSVYLVEWDNFEKMGFFEDSLELAPRKNPPDHRIRGYISLDIENGMTKVIMPDGTIGFSNLNPKDDFNFDLGVLIAIIRASDCLSKEKKKEIIKALF